VVRSLLNTYRCPRVFTGLLLKVLCSSGPPDLAEVVVLADCCNDSLTVCIPGVWSCQRSQCGCGDVLILYIYTLTAVDCCNAMEVLAIHCFITALSRNVIALMRHMLTLFLRVTHRLHPRGLQVSQFGMLIWRCVDYLHLHLHAMLPALWTRVVSRVSLISHITAFFCVPGMDAVDDTTNGIRHGNASLKLRLVC
jgi:hypothetical protein